MIPILMYHKVGAPVKEKADTFLNVSTQHFDRQMRLLKKLKYEAITFAEAVERLETGRPVPKRPICITFDDGYTNVAENAAPILAKLDWPGTVFIPTGYVGEENSWDKETGKPLLPILDWEGLQGLRKLGWEIAGHTRTHPHLDQMSDDAALNDILGGRNDLADNLGIRVRTFCYPFGGLNDRTPELVQEAGFMGACTTMSGLCKKGANPFLLPRVKIAYRDGVAGFFYRLKIRPKL